jgi:hypothetical protein
MQALRLLNAQRYREPQQEIQQLLHPPSPPPPPQPQTTSTAPQLLLAAQVLEQFLRTPGRAEPTNCLGAPVGPISSTSSSRHEQATSRSPPPPPNIHQENNEVDQRHQLLIESQEECKVAVAVVPPHQQQVQREGKNIDYKDEGVIIEKEEDEESCKYSTEDPSNKQDSNSNTSTTTTAARLDSDIVSLFDMGGLGSYFKANPTEEDDFVRIACKARRGMGSDHNFRVCTFFSHIIVQMKRRGLQSPSSSVIQ